MPTVTGTRARDWVGWLAGSAGVLLVTAVIASAPGDAGTAFPALALVIPVIVTAVLCGRWPALGVAAVAAATQAYAFLAPIRSLRVHVAQDLLALAAFVAVAVASAAVAGPARREQRSAAGRTELLLALSHDMRNPLGTIHAVSTDLRSGDRYDDDTRTKLLDVVIAESRRLDQLVGHLLAASRVESGSLRPAVESVPLANAVHDVTARYSGGSHSFEVEVAPDLHVEADPIQLDQLLTNLVGNAVRHTPPGTTVRVRAGRHGAMSRVEVSDDGPGLPPAAIATLNTEPGVNGGGVGLRVCRLIVEAHGGTIHALERSGGSHIAFTIPLAR